MKNQSLIIIILIIAIIGLGFWIYTGYLAIPKVTPTTERLQTTFDKEILDKLKTLSPHGQYPIEANLENAGRSDPFAPF